MAEALPFEFSSCIQPPLRRQLDKVAKNNDAVVRPLSVIVTNEGDVAISLEYLIPGDPPVTIAVAGKLFVEGTLDGDLTRDGTATLSVIDPVDDTDSGRNVEVHGRYVPSGKKIPSGSRLAAFWNGVRWRAKVTDACVVPA